MPGASPSAGCGNIQIFHRGWDAHGNLPREHESQCKDIDQGSAALIQDLKRQRGMLDETLVVWGGEFGRTAYCQGKPQKRKLRTRSPPALLHGLDGRRRRETGHHLRAAPTTTGTTSPTPRTPSTSRCYRNPDQGKVDTPGTMHIHDLNATILHLLGIDHKPADLPLPGPRLPPHGYPRACDARPAHVGEGRLRTGNRSRQGLPDSLLTAPPASQPRCAAFTRRMHR